MELIHLQSAFDEKKSYCGVNKSQSSKVIDYFLYKEQKEFNVKNICKECKKSLEMKAKEIFVKAVLNIEQKTNS